MYLCGHLSLNLLKQIYLLQKVHVMEQSLRAGKHELGLVEMKPWQQIHSRSAWCVPAVNRHTVHETE